MSLHLVPRSLWYIEQVAQLGSIQAASRELGISASAIHRQIKTIEEAMGEPLFDRDAKGMTLTTAGQLLLGLAREWRLDNARLWSVIQASRGVQHGHIRIAAMDGMVNGLVPELVARIASTFPKVSVEVEITSPEGATKGVLNGDFDLAAVANVGHQENLEFHWSRQFPLGVIAGPDHPIASLGTISFAELVTHPVVFQSASLSIRRLLEARYGWIFERAKNAVTVNSIQLMKLLVQTGCYVAVTSELDAGPEIGSGRLRFVPISDKDAFQQTISLISNSRMPVSTVSRRIIAIATELLERFSGVPVIRG
jgi:molybdate transport repressor ModE-like protein